MTQLVGTRLWGLPLMTLLIASCSLAPTYPQRLEVPESVVQLATNQCFVQRESINLVPEREFSTDGCTLWPDYEWGSCCLAHDISYWCGGSAEQRRQADRALRKCVAASGHPLIGGVMLLGTRLGGSRLLPTPWRWGYGWDWLAPMRRTDDVVGDVR